MFDSLSNSKLNLFKKCQFAWYCNYILGLPQEPKDYFIFGNAIDDYVCNMIQANKNGCEDRELILSDVTERFVSDMLQIDGIDIEVKKKRLYDVIKVCDEKMLPLLYDRAMDTQVKVEIPLFDVPFVGYIDVLMKDPSHMVDIKTAGRMWQQGKEKHERQALIYPYYNFSRYPDLKEVKFSYYIVTTSMNPKFEIREVIVTRERCFAFLDLLRKEANLLQFSCDMYLSSGDPHFFVPNHGHVYCSKKYCAFWETCEKTFGIPIKD